MSSNNFKKWSLEFSGCDGGDIGSPDRRSIWVCGIEWGGGHTTESLRGNINEDFSSPPTGYDDWRCNTTYIFNWQVLKLLAAIQGDDVSSYKTFAERVQPFSIGTQGYFKMNLYPISFKDTNEDRWQGNFSELTGFKSKQDYLSWCREFRLPKMRAWTQQANPALVVCLGKTYLSDFKSAFLDDDVTMLHEVIDDRDLYWAINKEGVLVVVIPFMVNRNGLVKNTSIQKFGFRISNLLAESLPPNPSTGC